MATAKRKPATKAAVAQHAEVAAVVEKVKAVKTPDVLKRLLDLQSEFTSSVGLLHGKVAAQLKDFEEVDLAITVQQQKLEALYEIEGEAAAIEEIQARRVAMEAQLAEEQAEKEKERQRADAEYIYTRDLVRRKEQDDYLRRRAERDADVLAREAKVGESEAELVSLREQVAGFDARLRAEVGKAESITSNRLTKDHEHALALIESQHAGERKLSEQTIQTLKDANERLIQQLAIKDKQVEDAIAEVSKIASKSVEGVGAQQALAAVQSTFQNQGSQKPSTSR